MSDTQLSPAETEALVQQLVKEGWRDALKSFGSKARGWAGGALDKARSTAAGTLTDPERSHRPPRRPGEDEDIEDITTVAEPDPGAPAIPGEVSVDTSDELSQETPLSVTKRQPDLKVGPGKNPQQIRSGGQKEAPLVMQLQKIGMSQQSAQQIAKRVAQYLQQRKIPVAEGVQYLLDNGFLESAMTLLEAREPDRAKILSQIRSSILGQLQALMKDKPSPESKQKGSQMALAMQGAAKSGNPDKFVKTLLRWSERGAKADASGEAGSRPAVKGWITTADGKASLQALPEEEILKFMKHLSGDKVFQKYHQSALEFRQAKAAGKAQRRSDIRGIGKSGREGEPGYKSQAANSIVGKIISRFVSDNQQLLDKDPGLQAIFDDPRKFNKLQKSVTNLLARQMQRRGYDAAEIQKFIGKKPPENMGPAAEEVVAECVREMTNLLVTTNRISRWKVLSGVK